MQDRRLARDLTIAVENISAALKDLLPGNDRVAVIQSRGSKVDALNCVRPAKQDLSVIQLVQIVRVSQLDICNNIALQAFLSGYDMRAGKTVVFICNADRRTVARFKLQLFRMFQLRDLLRQQRSASLIIFVTDQQSHCFHCVSPNISRMNSM